MKPAMNLSEEFAKLLLNILLLYFFVSFNFILRILSFIKKQARKFKNTKILVDKINLEGLKWEYEIILIRNGVAEDCFAKKEDLFL